MKWGAEGAGEPGKNSRYWQKRGCLGSWVIGTCDFRDEHRSADARPCDVMGLRLHTDEGTCLNVHTGKKVYNCSKIQGKLAFYIHWSLLEIELKIKRAEGTCIRYRPRLLTLPSMDSRVQTH